MPIAVVPSNGFQRDFRIFWTGQTISNVGNAVTFLMLPLLVYKLSGSALNLALTTVAEGLPYLLFGLAIGAWVDRLERKRLMIAVDFGRAAVLATIPILSVFDALTVWWIYVVAFIISTLSIAFNAAEFAAIPSLVETRDLVSANGRIQASYSAAFIAGPLIGGALLTFMPVEDVVLLDTFTFVCSACSLLLIRRSFNAVRDSRPAGSIRQDIVIGLRFVWHHPVLRAISIMMLLVNFVYAPVNSQFVLFAGERLHASDAQIGLLYAAGGVGAVTFSVSAGRLRRRWPFSRVALGALMVMGVMVVALAASQAILGAALLWALIGGAGVLFNINTGTLRQSITPNEMLGRIITIASVVSVAFTPLGSLVGGLAIERTGDIELVFAAIGVLVILIAAAFSRTALGRADTYMSPSPSTVSESGEQVEESDVSRILDATSV